MVGKKSPLERLEPKLAEVDSVTSPPASFSSVGHGSTRRVRSPSRRVQSIDKLSIDVVDSRRGVPDNHIVSGTTASEALVAW